MPENEPLKVGQPAPDFELMNQDKQPIKLADLRGKRIMLLFYPMDFSPVCTEEHCAFGPQLGQIAPDANTVVFGTSGKKTKSNRPSSIRAGGDI